MGKKTKVVGSYRVSITIPDNDGGAPDLDSLPELIEIPKGCTADIMFEFDEGVEAGWKFERFIIKPLAPLKNSDDFSIEEHPGTPVGMRGNGQEFALDERIFNVKDKNDVAGIFRYKLVAKHATAQVEVDPGIGNGGQN